MQVVRYFLMIISIAILLLVVMLSNADFIRDFFNPDQLIINTTQDIDKEKVLVKWSVEGSKDTLLIYEKGTVANKDYKEVGANSFFVYYQNILVGQFDIFKTEPWHGHEYFIIVGRDEELAITVDVSINGPDAHR